MRVLWAHTFPAPNAQPAQGLPDEAADEVDDEDEDYEGPPVEDADDDDDDDDDDD